MWSEGDELRSNYFTLNDIEKVRNLFLKNSSIVRQNIDSTTEWYQKI